MVDAYVELGLGRLRLDVPATAATSPPGRAHTLAAAAAAAALLVCMVLAARTAYRRRVAASQLARLQHASDTDCELELAMGIHSSSHDAATARAAVSAGASAGAGGGGSHGDIPPPSWAPRSRRAQLARLLSAALGEQAHALQLAPMHELQDGLMHRIRSQQRQPGQASMSVSDGLGPGVPASQNIEEEDASENSEQPLLPPLAPAPSGHAPSGVNAGSRPPASRQWGLATRSLQLAPNTLSVRPCLPACLPACPPARPPRPPAWCALC